MKKIILTTAIILVTATLSIASSFNDKPVTFEQLPQKAQTFIKTYFSQSKISYAKQDTDMFEGDYEVMFTDGNKVEFTKKGEWKDVECKTSEVPTAIIPQAITKFISEKHAGQKVVSIDRDSRDYDVKLSDRTELKFSLKGKFVGYDD